MKYCTAKNLVIGSSLGQNIRKFKLKKKKKKLKIGVYIEQVLQFKI